MKKCFKSSPKRTRNLMGFHLNPTSWNFVEVKLSNIHQSQEWGRLISAVDNLAHFSNCVLKVSCVYMYLSLLCKGIQILRWLKKKLWLVSCDTINWIMVHEATQSANNCGPYRVFVTVTKADGFQGKVKQLRNSRGRDALQTAFSQQRLT